MLKKKKAYICSPLSASTVEGILENMHRAREYMELVSEALCCRAVAPHAYLPEFLNDNEPKERILALEFGLGYLATCDMLVVCGDRITSGMDGELHAAMKLGIPIYIYSNGKLYFVIADSLFDGQLRGFRIWSEREKSSDYMKRYALQMLHHLLTTRGNEGENFICLIRG